MTKHFHGIPLQCSPSQRALCLEMSTSSGRFLPLSSSDALEGTLPQFDKLSYSPYKSKGFSSDNSLLLSDSATATTTAFLGNENQNSLLS